MDEPFKSFLSVASGVGLGQVMLFWVTRRSRKVDSRDEKELNLETSLIAERRDLLASLRAQLTSEQRRGARLEAEKSALLEEVFTLQKFANEVLAKYDFLRTLHPDALLPIIHVEPPASPSADPALSTTPEGGRA